MKKTFFLLFTLLSSAIAQAQQNTAGRIEYEVIPGMEVNNLRLFGNSPGEDRARPIIPDVMMSTQRFFYIPNKDKTEALHPNMPNFSGGANLIRPFKREIYVDLATQKYGQTRQPTDEQKTRYTEREPMTDLKELDKTQKIPWQPCNKASCRVKAETIRVCYSKEMPFDCSPLNGVLPEGKTVLALEGTRQSYDAKKVDFKPITVQAAGIRWENAEKLIKKQILTKRIEIM